MPSDRAPLQNNFIYTKTQTTKDICNTNNKLFMILYNCNFMMYCMGFHTGFLFGRVGGWGSECTSPGPSSSPSSLEDSAPVASSESSSQSLFTIGSVTAYTSGPSSTFWQKKLNFFENLKLINKPQPTFKSQNSMKYIYIIAKQLSLSQYSYK